MDRKSLRKSFIVSAMIVAVAGAALAARARTDPAPASTLPPATLEPFAVAQLLSQAPTDVVVVSLDEARHSMAGATPVELYGAGDEAFIAAAPKARRIVIAAKDSVRADRIARRLMATGRSVSVLAGGIDSWDKAMDADPPAPPESAGADVWDTYRTNVALRRYFGDASAAPPAAAPRPVALPPAGGAPKKREGC